LSVEDEVMPADPGGVNNIKLTIKLSIWGGFTIKSTWEVTVLPGLKWEVHGDHPR
jgi:hypothetical protein